MLISDYLFAKYEYFRAQLHLIPRVSAVPSKIPYTVVVGLRTSVIQQIVETFTIKRIPTALFFPPLYERDVPA